MLNLTFNDFTDLFLGINKKIIEEPDKYVNNINGPIAYLPFTVLEARNTDCNINLSDLCYTAAKIHTLCRNYIDYEELKEFKERIISCKGSSLTYYFKQKKPKQGTNGNNGPCIISVVLTKKSNKEKYYDECVISYRTTEINRRFYADLVLFNIFLKEMPENVKIQNYKIVIPKPFFHTKTVLFNLDLFDINWNLNNPVIDMINSSKVTFTERERYNYKSFQRITKKLLKEKTWKQVDMEKLSI